LLETADVLFPTAALVTWTLLAVLSAGLVWRWPRHWRIWCGLAIIGAGAVYLPAVMAIRPENYYALLEFLTSSMAVGAGLVLAAVGAFRLVSAASADPATERRSQGVAGGDLS
jgi:hypothetical protein